MWTQKEPGLHKALVTKVTLLVGAAAGAKGPFLPSLATYLYLP